jgi:hypothetical protein
MSGDLGVVTSPIMKTWFMELYYQQVIVAVKRHKSSNYYKEQGLFQGLF